MRRLRSCPSLSYGLVVLATVSFGACKPSAAPASGSTGRGGAGGAGGDRPAVVTAAAVQRQDVQVYLDGLGNVAAFYTATVHPQVDGPLQRVTFTEGQTVHQGELLAQIDPRPFEAALHQAEGALARDRGQLVANQRILERDLVLIQSHYVAPQDVDTQRGLVDQYQGSVVADQAAVEAARLNLQYTHIIAPIDGVTGIRQVDPGNLIHQADPAGLVVITQIDRVAVFFTLPEDNLPQISQQMAAGTLSVQVFSRDGTSPLGTGTVALVDNQINQQTATIRLKAVLPNPDRALWPSQFVKVRLNLQPRRGVLVIPSAAVQRGPQGTFVYTIGSDSHVTMQSVTIDQSAGDTTIVTDGLSEGQQVVVEGQARLRTGAAVSVHAASADGGVPGAATGSSGAHGHAGGHGAGGHGGHGGHDGGGAGAGGGGT